MDTLYLSKKELLIGNKSNKKRSRIRYFKKSFAIIIIFLIILTCGLIAYLALMGTLNKNVKEKKIQGRYFLVVNKDYHFY